MKKKQVFGTTDMIKAEGKSKIL